MKIWICIALLGTSLTLPAQSAGYISYEKVTTLDVELPPEMQQYQNLVPKEKRSTHELTFNDRESLYRAKPAEGETASSPYAGAENGVKVVTMRRGGGAVEVLYYSFADDLVVKTVDLMGKPFLVESPHQAGDWKITGEQKQILGYTCIKAECPTPSGTLTAWFSPQIAQPVGPEEWVGLPGAILALSSPGERSSTTITATAVDLTSPPATLRRPARGKRVSPEELADLQAQRIAEMEKMFGGRRTNGGNVIIRRSPGN